MGRCTPEFPPETQKLLEELKPYKTAKGSVQFPLDQPLPTELIRRIVEHRVEENTGKAPKQRRMPGADKR